MSAYTCFKVVMIRGWWGGAIFTCIAVAEPIIVVQCVVVVVAVAAAILVAARQYFFLYITNAWKIPGGSSILSKTFIYSRDDISQADNILRRIFDHRLSVLETVNSLPYFEFVFPAMFVVSFRRLSTYRGIAIRIIH